MKRPRSGGAGRTGAPSTSTTAPVESGHARLRAMVEASPAAMIVVGPGGLIEFANRTTLRLFGWPPDALRGLPIEVLLPARFHHRHVADRDRFLVAPTARPMGAGRELNGVRRDGTEFPVEIGLTPLDLSGGVRVLAAVVDITERRRMDEALREADRRKDEFLAMLAHELRNPLAPLTNAHRLLERVEALSDTGRTLLSMAQRQTRQLTRLVDDLLEVSRITNGKIDLRPERMLVGSAVRDAVESVEATIAERRQALSVHLPPEPVAIVADPVRVAQVLENLLNNASKYTPENGRIVVRVEDLGDGVSIAVTDDGIGIDPGQLSRLFELFMQVDNTLDRSRGGLGIGLALVKRLVELHGGNVEARSAGRGQGACFIVRLPRVAARAVPDAAAGRP